MCLVALSLLPFSISIDKNKKSISVSAKSDNRDCGAKFKRFLFFAT